MLKRLLIYLEVGLAAFTYSALLLPITSVVADVGVFNVSVATSWRRMNLAS